MKIFVINLKRSKERREQIEKQLKAFRLDYELFEAVDGSQMSEADLDKYLDHDHKYFRELKKGEIGCFLSHYGVLRTIADQKIPYALVLEDDIELSKKFPALLKKMEGFIKPGDTYLLYSTMLQPINFFTRKKIDNNYAIVDTDNIREIFGALAYIVTEDAARNIANNVLPINNVYDDWHRYCINGYIKNLQIVFPFPLKLSPAFSEIHDANLLDTKFGKAKTIIRKYKLFPFYQLMMMARRKKLLHYGSDLITLDGKTVNKKFL